MENVIQHLVPIADSSMALWLAVYYSSLSAVLFALYGLDKRAALRNRRRIQESTLHIFALAGGWPGALLARKHFRHKTVKQPFVAVFWGTLVVNCMLFLWVMTPQGNAYISTLLDDYAPFLSQPY